MTAKSTNAAVSPIIFYEVADSSESKTGIFETTGATESNIIRLNQAFLNVRFDVQNASSSVSSQAVSSAASSAATAATATASSVSSAAAVSMVFTMLQVQGVRVTTEGSSAFLAWDALPSNEIVGYNIYYGTMMGSYIQRRGVEKSATSITIRALPTGTTYYFAVRGVNGGGQETDFSQEVAVSIGNPGTSTSPLNANSIPTPTPGTGGDIAGDTGVSSVLLLLLLISAVTGTGLAFRRQLSAARA